MKEKQRQFKTRMETDENNKYLYVQRIKGKGKGRKEGGLPTFIHVCMERVECV